MVEDTSGRALCGRDRRFESDRQSGWAAGPGGCRSWMFLLPRHRDFEALVRRDQVVVVVFVQVDLTTTWLSMVPIPLELMLPLILLSQPIPASTLYLSAHD